MSEYASSEKSRVRRLPKRGNHEVKQVNAVLDEGLVCHVGFSIDGQPFVIPMAYARDGDSLLLHGSSVSRLLQSLTEGIPVCVTVTLVDGLVLARSQFHHSMNYRSAVVFGKARLITEEVAKQQALEKIVEHLIPGRTSESRPGDIKELNATSVIKVAIEEATLKSRSGPPEDAAKDQALPVWAGLIPLGVEISEPVQDPTQQAMDTPDYVSAYQR